MNTMNFNSMLSDFRPSLLQSALKFTRNHEDANDLVQETLIKAIRYETKYEEGTNFRGWLFTIMRNTFINNYRSLARRTAVMVQNVDPWSYPVDESTSKNHGEAKFMMEDIEKAMSCLEPVHSVPFKRYFEGYKYHEIAEELDIPIGTVKTRIHIARKLLKASLKMYGADYYKSEAI
jgi:RNA polymerase sigma factor (sigma-70 family)